MLNRLLFLSAFLCAFHFASAQKQSPVRDYKLLWKIEGKGLKKPSYLFGTMHLYDNRVFDFSDSVLLKLKECNAFAMEIHPDSMVAFTLRKMISRNNKNEFKDLLTPAEYKEIDSLMKLRTGYTLDNIRMPQLAPMMIEKKMGKKNKNIFLDIYLYSLAKKSGKKILGLEKTEDQLEIRAPRSAEALRKMLQEQTDPAAQEKQLEKMIDIYHRGNIDELNSLLSVMKLTNPEQYKKMFTDRNRGMAINIAKEIHQSTVFVAVGAGHLPGDEGVIRLLQKEGYRVTPVKSAFTGLAKKFKPENQKNEWETYKIEKGGYSVQTPDPMIPLRMDSLGKNLYTAVDLSGPSFFQTTFMTMDRELKGKSALVAIEKMESRLRARTGNDRMEYIKRVQVAGMEALEFGQTSKKDYYRNLFVLRDPMIYLLQAGPTKAVAHSKEADQFFSSLRVDDFPKEQWKEIREEEGAFTVLHYGSPKPSQNTVPYESLPVIIHFSISEDINLKETYLTRYNDLPPGYTSQNDSSFYANFAQDLKERVNGHDLKLFDANISGFSGTEFSIEVGSEELIKGRMVLRGNRFYLLMASTTKGNAARSGINTFFSSFRFQPYKPATLKEYTLGDLKINLPAPYRFDSSYSTGKQKVYYSLDPQSGMQFMIRTEQLSAYKYSSDKKEFFDSYYTRPETDTILAKTSLDGKNYFGEETIARSRKVNYLTQTQTFVHGRDVYEVSAFVPEDSDLTNVVTDYFKSIKIPDTRASWNVFTPKTDVLLADLASTDSLTQAQAKSALYSYPLPTSELPKLYQAIQKNYSDDLNEQNTVRRSLLYKLTNVHDSTTVPFIQQVYSRLPHTAHIRSSALQVLSSLNTKTAAETLLKLVQTEDGKLESYQVLSGLMDSLELAGPLLPELLKREEMFNNSWYLFSLTANWLEKVNDPALRSQLIQLIKEKAKRELGNPKVVTTSDENYYDYSSLYSSLARCLLQAEADSEVKQTLNRITQTGYPAAMIITLPYLAKLKEKPDHANITKLAADPLFRLQFYEALKEINEEKLFPAAFKTQGKLAESMLVQYMDSEDGAPETIELIGPMTVQYQESKQKIFVFKYKYSPEDEWMLAMAGPFKEKELTSDQSLTYPTYTPYVSNTLTGDMEKVLKDAGATLVK
jgi:uncharacterized protein YbaP (TraB family)